MDDIVDLNDFIKQNVCAQRLLDHLCGLMSQSQNPIRDVRNYFGFDLDNKYPSKETPEARTKSFVQKWRYSRSTDFIKDLVPLWKSKKFDEFNFIVRVAKLKSQKIVGNPRGS